MQQLNKTGDDLLIATFLLGQAAFGVDTAQIQEVVRVGEITPVRHAPPFVVGIRNLRGRIVTVIDLRTRLELGRVEPHEECRILIVETLGEPVGLLVDRVADTLTIPAAEIVPPPPNVHGVQARNLMGICRGGGRLVALLDLAPLLELETHAVQRIPREHPAT
jgi:purine-binding chemotaxis protein CheW